MVQSIDVVLIPARGGSKGVPRKNLLTIGGRPLIGHTVASALGSSVDQTWVSTEDAEIKAVSLELGAHVIDRPKKLAKDSASTESVMLHFAENLCFGKMVLLQCTSPSTTPEDIDLALEMLEQYDSVVAVTRLHQFVWTEGVPNYDPRNRPRRQEAKKTYLETGALFAIRRDALLKHRCRLGGTIGFLEVPRSRSFDIDTLDDAQLLEKLLR